MVTQHKHSFASFIILNFLNIPGPGEGPVFDRRYANSNDERLMIVAQWGMWVTRPNQNIELFVLVAQLLFARFTSLRGDTKLLTSPAWMRINKSPSCAWGVYLDPDSPSSVAAFQLREANPDVTREQFFAVLGAPVPASRTTYAPASAANSAAGNNSSTGIFKQTLPRLFFFFFYFTKSHFLDLLSYVSRLSCSITRGRRRGRGRRRRQQQLEYQRTYRFLPREALHRHQRLPPVPRPLDSRA